MGNRDICLALWVVFLWSSSLVVQKLAVGHLSVFILSFLRAALVCPLVFFVPKPKKEIWKYFVCSFFFLVLNLPLLGYGLRTDLGAGVSSFFIQTQVFFTVLFCYLLLGEKPTWYQILGIICSSVGIYFLKATSSSADVPLLGVILILASCASFGFGMTLSKKFQIGHSMGDIIWISFTGAISLFFLSLFVEGPTETLDIILTMSPMVMACVVFITLISTLWASFLWLNLAQRLSASTITPFMLLLPVCTSVTSSIFLGEVVTTLQVLCGLIIIMGVVIAQALPQKIFSFFLQTKNRLVS